ncbi:MAG TPA: fibronectin type III domain-containing protein, partial [Tepidisphaeraceae bacterium]|nr:fibronectin type III domain-containing protein [Tepidisphaeraceae bacterium]
MPAKTRTRSDKFTRAAGASCETLENRLLFAAQISVTTSAVNNAVAFNTIASGNSGAGPSRIETATITDTGGDPLTLGGAALSIVNDPSATPAASDFAITNAAGIPASLAPGASFTVDLQYTATAVGLQSALLQIQSNDPVNPTYDVNLHGIGTPGQFGTAEPSLKQVLLANNIPTIIGAGPDDANVNTQAYPVTPDPSSQEVPMQRLVVATAGQPVTITPLASFSAATPAVSRIGYYTPGDPAATSELFYIGQGDAQTVDPTALGATGFSPGSAPFGLYAVFPGTTIPSGGLDIHYSEDALNTGSTDGLRKVRFFPMETANGTVVPNTYVLAMEDYDSSAFNSFINFVGIISNVKAAPNATMGSTPSSPTANNPPVMGVNLNETSPGSTTLVFNRIDVPNSISPDIVHDTNVITINNTGDQALTLNSLTLSDTTNWQLVNPPAAGTQIAAGSSLNLTIKFIATTNPPHSTNETNDVSTTNGIPTVDAGGVWSATLTINSNDPVNPNQAINLAGYWQYQSEHENEPNVNTLTNLLWGYGISDTGSASTQGTEFPNNGNSPVIYGSEVDPSTDQGLLVAADPSQPVSLVEIAAYHSQYGTPKAYVTTNGQAQEVDLASLSESGSTVTVTTDNVETFQPGQQVSIISVTPQGYQGTFTITSTPNSTTFTYSAASGLGPTSPFLTQSQAGWYPSGGSTTLLYKDQPNNGQSLYPLLDPSSLSTVQTTFTPSGAFGLNLDGMLSQDSLNSQDLQYNASEHALRFWPVTQANGQIIPNAWIVGLDYRNYVGPNSDYQDLFMLLTNATFESVPPAPIDLNASQGASGVNVQWTPMTGATGYNIMSSVNGGAFTKLNSSPVTATSFVDTTAPTGAAITYEVFAVNSGGVSSLPADASINLSSAVTPPSAPAFVQADGSSGTQVSLAWTAPAGATGYNLQREAPGQSSFTTIASDLTSASFSDLNVTAGATYTYQVQALNSAGASAFGAPVSVTVAQGVPPAPTNVQFSTTASSVVLTWAAASGATSYEVQRQNPGQSSYSIIASSLTGLTYTDTGVVAGKTYSYQIIAADAAGMSPPSSAVSATVPAAASTLIVTVGKAADSFVKFTTSGGAVVTITLNGPGAAAVSFTADSISQSASGKGAVLSGTNIAIAGIAITATTAGSSLSIATHGGSNSVNLGGITLGASMNSINAPTASLVGALTAAGSINRITFGSVVAAAMSIAGNL